VGRNISDSTRRPRVWRMALPNQGDEKSSDLTGRGSHDMRVSKGQAQLRISQKAAFSDPAHLTPSIPTVSFSPSKSFSSQPHPFTLTCYSGQNLLKTAPSIATQPQILPSSSSPRRLLPGWRISSKRPKLPSVLAVGLEIWSTGFQHKLQLTINSPHDQR
jgi:hypothetical protein